MDVRYVLCKMAYLMRGRKTFKVLAKFHCCRRDNCRVIGQKHTFNFRVPSHTILPPANEPREQLKCFNNTCKWDNHSKTDGGYIAPHYSLFILMNVTSFEFAAGMEIIILLGLSFLRYLLVYFCPKEHPTRLARHWAASCIHQPWPAQWFISWDHGRYLLLHHYSCRSVTRVSIT